MQFNQNKPNNGLRGDPLAKKSCQMHHNTSFPETFLGGKAIKKILISLAILLAILIGLALFMPPMGHITPKAARGIREVRLMSWHRFMKSFLTDNSRLPRSMYELYMGSGWEGTSVLFFPFGRELSEDEEQMVLTAEGFYQLTEYDLLLNGHGGWFIRELRPGVFYPHMLMIDQDGKIYQFQEIPSAFQQRDEIKIENKRR